MSTTDEVMSKHLQDHFSEYTYDMFMMNMSSELEEMDLFSEWVEILNKKKSIYF